eukprot:CAMPEP_0197643194 /NCGR_PEP_ID=MMETSP1338-20131121/16607_1 /TAXON_ID=43686 ORGANISM="Pelagodinium beii, Strain RCC1491" /NCGR_SAMPLE_ID=MMETSP1338 /ASSEMBLY_ACC=CAM_ASM_000754 /LENGTH=158 /DNA_ID=CAMNT_0043216423 /DNA_START=13 /DNA_END=486 /DNA_ORIENTATION=-
MSDSGKRRREEELESPAPKPGSQGTVLRTPEKRLRVEQAEVSEREKLAASGLLHVHQAIPDFTGRLLECLADWAEARKPGQEKLSSEVKFMLSTGQTAQDVFVLGLKEGRLGQETRSARVDYVYMQMCDVVQAACPQAWVRSRKLTYCSTADADYRFA